MLIVTVFLFVVNGILFKGEYSERLASYKQDAKINFGLCSITVSKRPNPFSFCVSGGEKQQPSSLIISFCGVVGPERTFAEEQNFTLPRFEDIDWAFIIKALFGIFAVILAYDAICGEKENGTLALVCSYSIPRGLILLAKFSAAIVTLIIPLVIGMLISLLLLQTTMLNLETQSFIRLGFFTLVSIIYISFFVFLSLFISSVTHRSSIALLLLLSSWVVFVVVIPGLADVLAEPLAGIPGEYEYYKKQVSVMFPDEKELEKRINAKRLKPITPGIASKEMKEETLKIIDEAGERWRKLFLEKTNAVRFMEDLGRNLSRLSPAAAFQYAGEAIADSGLKRQRRFFDAADNFYTVFKDWIQQSTGRKFIKYPYPMIFPFKVKVDGEEISIPVSPSFFGKVDKGMPEFKEQRVSLAESLKKGFFDLSLLILFSGCFFLLSYISFIRYDVR
jgi:ABC-type transport system involved in multi-copper enzyme maturation permease subunit